MPVRLNVSVRLATVFFLLGLMGHRLEASHGVAGDITYRSLGSGRYTINLTTYTDPCAQGVDQCVADIEAWARLGSGSFVQLGDSDIRQSLESIPRSNGSGAFQCGEPACGNGRDGNPIAPGQYIRPIRGGGQLKKNVYSTEVTFSGVQSIQLRYYFVARRAGFNNIPNSDTRAWYISTELFTTSNSSPQFLNVPYDDACTNVRWTHNPGAQDPEGDTIRYRLVPSRTYAPELGVFLPEDVPGYTFPDRTGANIPGTFTIDSLSGVITWDTPREAGIYAVGIQVQERRAGGVRLEVLREMAIFVEPCTNRPPEIDVVRDTCVDVQVPIRFPVRVRDPDGGQRVDLRFSSDPTLSGNASRSKPFNQGAVLDPPGNVDDIPQRSAVMPNPIGANEYPIVSYFNWTLSCALITNEHQFSLYAIDNGNPTLSASSVTRLRVNPPPARNVVVTGLSNDSAEITWDAPLGCTPTQYSIWRAQDSIATASNPRCCDGTGGAGYVKIAEVASSARRYVDGRTTPLPYRGKYCYRVVAEYLDLGGRGTGNLVGSCPSNQDCFIQRAVTPRIELISVAVTNATTGRDSIRWRQPDLNDPIFGGFSGYRLFRSESPTGPLVTVPGWETPRTDTVFYDNNLNTAGIRYYYEVYPYNATGGAINSSRTQASSVFLAAAPADERAALSWTWDTPWVNDSFAIFRRQLPTDPWTRVGSVPSIAGNTTATYIDLNLTNGQTYEYYVHSKGRYSSDAPSVAPIYNRSNIASVTVRDTLPPCPPSFTGVADCGEPNGRNPQITFTITPPALICGEDIASYILYYRRSEEDRPLPVDTIPKTTTTFVWNGTSDGNIVGCYQIAAVDSSGNVGIPTPPQCLATECTEIQLPNVFTPNGDGVNDVFKPISGYNNYQPFGILSIRSLIYDRSGRQLNVSTNPNNLWDGNVNGTPAAAGVYFYRVEIEVEGRRRDNKIIRVGTVTLLR